MAIHLKGRAGRQFRRREIIARLFEIPDLIVRTMERGSSEGTIAHLESLNREHRTLLLELTELATIDDQRIHTKK